MAAAENDASCPPEQLARLEKALAKAGVRHTVETYPAAHGFAVPDNPTYDPAADDRHWGALEGLYGTALGWTSSAFRRSRQSVVGEAGYQSVPRPSGQ